MNIAITAASGKLGSAIVKALLAHSPEHHIIALARTPEKAQHLGVEVRLGDYNDPAQLLQSLHSVDVLLLVSGMDSPDKRIQQHRNVIEAAKQAGVQKIVYTSVQGAEAGTAFSPVIQSNRQTEKDVRESTLEWVIGRNGIYIEPDVEYIDTYQQVGGIFNCAAEGKCGYTTRDELGFAYAKMLTENHHNDKTYNLSSEPITQYQLADYLNLAFDTQLTYQPITFEQFKQRSITDLGEFIGTVVAGIYQGISQGKADNPSHFTQAAGREHISWNDYFSQLKSKH
ncbi:SDR family oxidoreductase [Shewanella phaeophyticola]|uniref:SDR family oxidoreductase n=1 Tax=Shewanella phaeophyticola TaxID=2978345 RepID=A0ABT2P5L6_9GAMM|nr:SDR family oxidoreductase [Shewanella sp. KJ10-1]MCT8987962.1 SDR family oxidoreductase [Shewanella sp. KJ10-1]